jgi:hypothetical protein
VSAKVELQNLQAFYAELRKLPDDLATEAKAIVETHAIDFASRTQSGYPVGQTGNLKRGVTKQIERMGVSVFALVRTRAQHAWLYDNGSKERRTRTGESRGSMPARPEAERFVPRAIRVRERMNMQLMDLVRRAGLEVSE